MLVSLLGCENEEVVRRAPSRLTVVCPRDGELSVDGVTVSARATIPSDLVVTRPGPYTLRFTSASISVVLGGVSGPFVDLSPFVEAEAVGSDAVGLAVAKGFEVVDAVFIQGERLIAGRTTGEPVDRMYFDGASGEGLIVASFFPSKTSLRASAISAIAVADLRQARPPLGPQRLLGRSLLVSHDGERPAYVTSRLVDRQGRVLSVRLGGALALPGRAVSLPLSEGPFDVQLEARINDVGTVSTKAWPRLVVAETVPATRATHRLRLPEAFEPSPAPRRQRLDAPPFPDRPDGLSLSGPAADLLEVVVKELDDCQEPIERRLFLDAARVDGVGLDAARVDGVGLDAALDELLALPPRGVNVGALNVAFTRRTFGGFGLDDLTTLRRSPLELAFARSTSTSSNGYLGPANADCPASPYAGRYIVYERSEAPCNGVAPVLAHLDVCGRYTEEPSLSFAEAASAPEVSAVSRQLKCGRAFDGRFVTSTGARLRLRPEEDGRLLLDTPLGALVFEPLAPPAPPGASDAPSPTGVWYEVDVHVASYAPETLPWEASPLPGTRVHVYVGRAAEGPYLELAPGGRLSLSTAFVSLEAQVSRQDAWGADAMLKGERCPDGQRPVRLQRLADRETLYVPMPDEQGTTAERWVIIDRLDRATP